MPDEPETFAIAGRTFRVGALHRMAGHGRPERIARYRKPEQCREPYRSRGGMVLTRTLTGKREVQWAAEAWAAHALEELSDERP